MMSATEPSTPLKKTLSDLKKQIETKASMRGVPLMPEKLDELVQKRDTLLAIQEAEREQRSFQREEADRVIAAVREETVSGSDKTCNAVAEAKDVIVGEMGGLRGDMNAGFAMLREFFTGIVPTRKPRASRSSKTTDEETQKTLQEKQAEAKKRKADADERKAKKEEEKRQKEADRKAKKEEADRLKQAKAKATQDLKDFMAKLRPAKKAKTGEQETGEPEAVESREPGDNQNPSEDVAEPPAEVKESDEQDIANAENPPAVEEATSMQDSENPPAVEEAVGGDAPSGRARLFNFVGLASKS